MAQSAQTRRQFGIVEVSDNMHLGNAGDGFNMVFDGTNTLNIDPENANDILRIGETNQADLQLDGGTDLVFDASLGSLENGGFIVPCIPDAIREVIAAANPGALSVAAYGSDVSADAGGDAFTLADGTVIGQLKEVSLDATAGGTAVITPATFVDGSTITMAAAGDTALLVWTGASGWRLIQSRGGVVA